jgi:hypothetical protein
MRAKSLPQHALECLDYVVRNKLKGKPMLDTCWTRFSATATTSVMLLGLAASVATARAEDVLKIGVAISQSGTFVREGQFLLEGYELWAEKANAAGGVKVGDKTYKVQLISFDDESQAQTSAKLTERLISNEKVQFLFGPYSSGIANATAAISERYKMLTLDPMATAINLVTRGYKYFFCPAALGNTGLWPILELAQHLTPKPQTVAIVGPDDLFPNNNAAGAKEKAEQLGMKVVYTAKYPKGAPDLSAVATGIKSANPDLVLGSGYTRVTGFSESHRPSHCCCRTRFPDSSWWNGGRHSGRRLLVTDAHLWRSLLQEFSAIRRRVPKALQPPAILPLRGWRGDRHHLAGRHREGAELG